MGSLKFRIAGLAMLASLAALIAGAPAQANLLNFSPCDGSTLSQPFLQWWDPGSYELAPSGNFEGSLAGWTLTGGAQQVPGSETFGVTGSVGSYSLSLPNGATASSPQACVDAAYPSFRFFTLSETPGTIVTASVTYTSPLGTVTVPVGVVAPTSSWEPTPVFLTGSAVPALLGNGITNVQLEFSASGGAAQIDDVFIDPWSRG
jgi:hypothetical protein